MSKTVYELLRKALEDLGADGLVNCDAECGCGLDVLDSVCDAINGRHCEAARRVKASDFPGALLWHGEYMYAPLDSWDCPECNAIVYGWSKVCPLCGTGREDDGGD